MKLYTMQSVDDFVNNAIDNGGQLFVIREGTLLDYGLAVVQRKGYMWTVIQEKYLNEWSSAYKIRRYRVLPKKYSDMVDAL